MKSPSGFQSISGTLLGPIPLPGLRAGTTLLPELLSLAHGGAEQSAYVELWGDSL